MGADLIHFEIPADDVSALTEFYTKTLHWTINPSASGLEGYHSVETSDGPGVSGGLYERKSADQKPLNYFKVDNLDIVLAAVEKNGGKLADPKSAIKGIGYYAVCLDPEGNAFGLWEDNTDAE